MLYGHNAMYSSSLRTAVGSTVGTRDSSRISASIGDPVELGDGDSPTMRLLYICIARRNVRRRLRCHIMITVMPMTKCKLLYGYNSTAVIGEDKDHAVRGAVAVGWDDGVYAESKSKTAAVTAVCSTTHPCPLTASCNTPTF